MRTQFAPTAVVFARSDAHNTGPDGKRSRPSKSGPQVARREASFGGLPVIPFYLTFVAVLLSGLAARDQVTLASVTQVHGKRPLALVVAIVVSICTAALAGYAAWLIVPQMQPAARVFLCAMAVAFAGAELIVIAPRAAGREPTHSLGALLVVLGFHQLTDAARFIVFGIAVAAKAPITAAGGGALGGIVLVSAAWAFPALVLDRRARIVRRVLGVGFVLTGAYIAMRAVDWI